MSGDNDSDAYSEEGQLTEGANLNIPNMNNNNDNDNDNDDDNLDIAPWSGKTPGGPTPGGPDNDNNDGDDDDGSSCDEDNDDDNVNNRNSVDLCILCDATDSMDFWLLEVKNEIRRIVNELKNTFGIGRLRAAFIGYRDWNDDNNNKGEKRIERLNFTTNIKKFEQFVENVKAIGGGDAAEDVLGGIQETINLSWKSEIRLIYHICDAPAHGTMYHDLYEQQQKQQKKVNHFKLWLDDDLSDDSSDDESKDDNDDEIIIMKKEKEESNSLDRERENKLMRDEMDKWPNKHPKDPKHEDLFLALKKKNVQFHIGKQGNFVDKMVSVFQEYCKSIDYNFNILDLVNVSQFFPTLIEAVSDAIRIIAPPKKRQIELPSLPQLRKKRKEFKVFCGIDFGTAGSGFAYALPGKNEVYTDQNWNDSGKHIDVKTKTNILLDAEGNCIAFGDDATEKYVHMDKNQHLYLFFERFKMALYNKEKIEHEEEKKIHDDDNKNDKPKQDEYRTDIREFLIATNGKKLESRRVLEEAIRFMKDHALKIIKNKVNKELKISDIQWILTVPAIWSDQAKSVMKTAAINAGMINADIDNQLIIAYEPDCASLSIQSELKEKLLLMKRQQKLMKKKKKLSGNIDDVKNNNNDDSDSDSDDDDDSGFFNRGDRMLLCDLGGGTADIACHEIDDNDCIKEIAAPSGGAWGSTYVDENFQTLLKEIFSEEWMNEFQNENPAAYIELLKNFRDAKKNFGKNDDKNKKKKIKKKDYDVTYHNIQTPFIFVDFMNEKCEEKADENEDNDGDNDKPDEKDENDQDEDEDEDDDDELEMMVRNFRGKFDKKGLVRLSGEYLELSYTAWHYLFDQVINEIINHCKKLLSLASMKDGGCKYLCLVGGFSESRYLQSKMYKNFGKKSKYDLMIFTPKRPILSVVDGAARMGLKPDFISARTIGKTYGIAIQKDIDEFNSIYPNILIPKNKISKRLIYDKNNDLNNNKNKKMMISKQVINDVFFPFIRKDTLIKIDDKPIIYYVEPADIKTNIITIKLFNSSQIDPIFVDGIEDNKITIKLPKNEYNQEAIPLIFVFNDTTIRVFVDIKDNDGINQTKEVSINFDVKR